MGINIDTIDTSCFQNGHWPNDHSISSVWARFRCGNCWNKTNNLTGENIFKRSTWEIAKLPPVPCLIISDTISPAHFLQMLTAIWWFKNAECGWGCSGAAWCCDKNIPRWLPDSGPSVHANHRYWLIPCNPWARNYVLNYLRSFSTDNDNGVREPGRKLE